MKLVANYCKGTKMSLSEVFFGDVESLKALNETMNSTKGKSAKLDKSISESAPATPNFKSHIHIFTIYSLEEKVSQFFLKKKDEASIKDFKLLFNLFALEASNDDKTTIPFNHIYRVATNTSVKKIKNL